MLGHINNCYATTARWPKVQISAKSIKIPCKQNTIKIPCKHPLSLFLIFKLCLESSCKLVLLPNDYKLLLGKCYLPIHGSEWRNLDIPADLLPVVSETKHLITHTHSWNSSLEGNIDQWRSLHIAQMNLVAFELPGCWWCMSLLSNCKVT